ncbi:unnamed protein product [Protopolystoma xenopodis]|uniref:Uncharacterized protein n=1 Tax=Protopolystoma xenopodis TaxID=117903 RepID=A0A448X109_9PLAT|nr:unnamed protein product [Protopolystoma xenopodis]
MPSTSSYLINSNINLNGMTTTITTASSSSPKTDCCDASTNLETLRLIPLLGSGSLGEDYSPGYMTGSLINSYSIPGQTGTQCIASAGAVSNTMAADSISSHTVSLCQTFPATLSLRQITPSYFGGPEAFLTETPKDAQMPDDPRNVELSPLITNLVQPSQSIHRPLFMYVDQLVMVRRDSPALDMLSLDVDPQIIAVESVAREDKEVKSDFDKISAFEPAELITQNTSLMLAASPCLSSSPVNLMNLEMMQNSSFKEQNVACQSTGFDACLDDNSKSRYHKPGGQCEKACLSEKSTSITMSRKVFFSLLIYK